MVVQLHPHQEKAVERLDNGKILCGDVGSGKTHAALAYFYIKVCGGVLGDLGSMTTPKDLYIITTAKKRDTFDWQDTAAQFSLISNPLVSVGGVKVTVDSWNNIDKYKEVKNAFFIFDEQRLVGSGAWTKSFIRIAKSNGWILLSATPGDTWLDYIPVFVANGFYQNRTEFKRRHVVYNTFTKFPKVDRYLEVGLLVRLRNEILVPMPVLRHTKRHLHEVAVEYDHELFERVVKDRWHVYENRPLRDVAELFSVMRKVVNSDSSRLIELKKLMQKHSKLIVFYNFDYELEILRTLVSRTSPIDPSNTLNQESLDDRPSRLKTTSRSTSDESYATKFDTLPSRTTSRNSTTRLTTSQIGSHGLKTVSGSSPIQTVPTTASGPPLALAEWNGHKHEPIPTTDRWVYLVQYQAGAEGWNCIDTDAVAFYSLTYSYRNFYQCQGRIDRLNTPFSDLNYYILKSSSIIDKGIGGSLKNKKNFNERTFCDKLDISDHF